MMTLFCLLFALTAQAGEFEVSKTHPEKIECSNKKEIIQFADIKQSYSIYDSNAGSVKLISCEKMQIKGFVFYTILFSSEIPDGSNVQKILTYEVALLNQKLNTLKTLRSEIVDQIELTGDLTSTKFENSIKTEWGQSTKDKSVLLKVNITTEKKTTLSYLLKLNSKLFWFENVFDSKTSEKTKN